MDRMIYTSMSGAKATLQRQDSLSNNLANASTTGFRAELQQFRSVPIRGDGATTRAFALETTAGYNDATGPVQATGRNLDVAVKGKSWLAVQSLEGTEAYTRNGAFDVDSQGQLVTMSGMPVLSDGGTITIPPNASVDVGEDGTVTATVQGQAPLAVGRIKMVTPETALVRGTDGLFRAQGGDPLDADPNARLQSGALEGSNVSSVQTMVDMIAAARQFEAQMKMMNTAESDERAAAQLLSAG